MLLAIDIGNTNVVVGVFEGEKLRATWRFSTDVHKMPDEYAVLLLNLLPRDGLAPSDITEAVLSSVVPPLVSTFQEMCRRYFGVTPLAVEAGIKTGVRVTTDNPREVGADRIVNAMAAYHLYGGPAIVIDMGTATTLDAVSAEGDFLGAAIAPGIGMAAEALYQRTAKLPRVDLAPPPKAIGRNTVHSMQSGLVFGYVGLIEGIVERIRRELGERAKVIGTGGLVGLIASQTSVIDVVNPDLTLIGLRLIHNLNGSESERPARKKKGRAQG